MISEVEDFGCTKKWEKEDNENNNHHNFGGANRESGEQQQQSSRRAAVELHWIWAWKNRATKRNNWKAETEIRKINGKSRHFEQHQNEWLVWLQDILFTKQLSKRMRLLNMRWLRTKRHMFDKMLSSLQRSSIALRCYAHHTPIQTPAQFALVRPSNHPLEARSWASFSNIKS